MTFQPLTNWHGWLERYGYKHADPFSRPLPIPEMGIFDNPDISLCLNSQWRPIIAGALSRLLYPELFIVDDTHDGDWAVLQAHKLMGVIGGAQNPCAPLEILETQCAYYPSWYAGIQYIPHNPFDGDSGFDPLYPVAPFFRFGKIDTFLPNWLDDFFQSAIEYATGYQENDILVSYLSLPTLTNPFDGLDYPTIKITVQGTGKIRLHLLAVPFGGRALITVDNPPDVGDIFNAIWSVDDRLIELNRDIVSFPPEMDMTEIEEISIDTEGTHEIYITYLFVVNDEAPLIQMGGGFRGYEICGGLTVIDPTTGNPIDFTNTNEAYQGGIIVATEQDLYNALVRFQTEQANRWLLASDSSNVANDVLVDKITGAINIQKPLLSGATNVTAQSGDMINGQSYEIAGSVIDRINQIRSWFNDDDLTQPEIEERATNIFSYENTGLVADIITHATTPLSLNIDTMAEILFNAQNELSGLAEYAYSLGVEGRETVLAIQGMMTDAVKSVLERKGSTKPRTEWKSYASTLRQDVEFIFSDASQSTQTYADTTHSSQNGNRLVWVEVSGKFSGQNGEQLDIAYITDGQGNRTRQNWNFIGYDFLNQVFTTIYPPQNIEYNESGSYKYSAVLSDERSWTLFRMTPPADAWIDTASGQITIKIIDLGKDQ